MPSAPCDALRKQGYLFFSPASSAALKPCLWCKRALAGGDMCYKHQFYGIDSHRCVMTPTLRCNQRCLFCWRSFEHEVAEEEECLPEMILAGVKKLQKKALAGYNAVLDNSVTEERWQEALAPRHVAISLSGEPPCSAAPGSVDLFNADGYTTFVVSNGTNPDMLARCRPFQQYVSLDAPDVETYERTCRPMGDAEGYGTGLKRASAGSPQNDLPCGSRFVAGTMIPPRKNMPRCCRTRGQRLSRSRDTCIWDTVETVCNGATSRSMHRCGISQSGLPHRAIIRSGMKIP